MPYTVVISERDLELGMYVPVGVDSQRPHDRDELYVVVEGSGTFVRDGERVTFAPGDAIYVPAGMEHRFEDFSAPLRVWVVFIGEARNR
jgi:mannose-6-phosphate isomerase-like protein (cupin superfamily)